MRICCVELTNISLIIFYPQFAVTVIFLSKNYSFNQNQFFVVEFVMIWRVFVRYRISIYFRIRIAVTAFLASENYSFDQNRIFVSKFNVSIRNRHSQLYQSEICQDFDFLVQKLRDGNQFFLP